MSGRTALLPEFLNFCETIREIVLKLSGADRTGRNLAVNENQLLERITFDPQIFGGKPIIRGRRLAVEHVLGMLAAGDSLETILEGYPWLEREDVQACLVYARRMVGHKRIEPMNAAS